MFKRKINKTDLVIVKETGRRGIVTQVCYNPYLPNWLSSPNYMVRLEGGLDYDVFKRNQIKLLTNK